jgi:hypothetical protein
MQVQAGQTVAAIGEIDDNADGVYLVSAEVAAAEGMLGCLLLLCAQD